MARAAGAAKRRDATLTTQGIFWPDLFTSERRPGSPGEKKAPSPFPLEGNKFYKGSPNEDQNEASDPPNKGVPFFYLGWIRSVLLQAMQATCGLTWACWVVGAGATATKSGGKKE